MAWDRHLEHWIVEQRVGWLDWFFIALTWIGRLGFVWLVIAAVLAITWRRPVIFVMTLVADLAADLLAELIKALVPRHRPYEHQLGPPSSTHSFPSGHAATSFACATVLSHYAPRYRVAFYVLASLIAFSRLYNGMHYPTDVIAGALLGVLVGTVVLRGAKRFRGAKVSDTTGV